MNTTSNRFLRKCHPASRRPGWAVLAAMLALVLLAPPVGAADLEQGWENPPTTARRAYWWWLNGNVTRAAIARPGGDEGQGVRRRASATPAAPSRTATIACRTGRRSSRPSGARLYKHALREADRLGLEMRP